MPVTRALRRLRQRIAFFTEFQATLESEMVSPSLISEKGQEEGRQEIVIEGRGKGRGGRERENSNPISLWDQSCYMQVFFL